jgi:hypothetical protein
MGISGARHRGAGFRLPLDTIPQISAFVNLKLTKCAPILGLPGSVFLCVRKSGKPDLRSGKPRRGFSWARFSHHARSPMPRKDETHDPSRHTKPKSIRPVALRSHAGPSLRSGALRRRRQNRHTHGGRDGQGRQQGRASQISIEVAPRAGDPAIGFRAGAEAARLKVTQSGHWGLVRGNDTQPLFHDQSALAPENLTTLAHFSVSSAMNLRK